MTLDIPTVAQMAEITNALNALIVAIVLGAASVVGAYFYQMRISLPRQFKLRDEQRELDIEKIRKEYEMKIAAQSVDIERERLLPQLMEQNRIMQSTTVQLAQSFNETMMHLVQQNATSNSTMLAHTRAVTSVAEKQEEFRQAQETSTLNIQLLEKVTSEARDASMAASVFSNKAATAAEETLDYVRKALRPPTPTPPGDVIPLDDSDDLEAVG
jgi:hypothetical protein